MIVVFPLRNAPDLLDEGDSEIVASFRNAYFFPEKDNGIFGNSFYGAKKLPAPFAGPVSRPPYIPMLIY